MASCVQVTKVVQVIPSEPTPSHVLTLSAIDSQLFLRFTIEYLLVYRSLPGSDRNTISTRIKSALARALVPYYPLAGRVRAPPDGSNLEVVCRAQGAVFIESFSDFTVSEFDRAPTHSNQWVDLLSLRVSDVLRGYPPLVVQLTWLADGGAAIGVGLNHCVCDGIGSGEFLNLFAEFATGQSGLGDFKPKPVWDRHLLDPISGPVGKPVSLPTFNRSQDLCGFASLFSEEPLAPTSVTFDRRCLNELMKLSSSTSRLNGLSYTSFELLSAHVWRCWAKALELPSKQTLKLLFSINVRNRVTPSLPVGFYGNGFVLGCVQTSVKDLTEKGLGWAAELVRRAKERVGDEYVREVIDAVSELRARPDSVGVLILSQWSRLGLDMVDFGLGKPVHVGPICCDRYCLFLPVHKQRDAVKVMVAVPRSNVEKYEYLLRSPWS